MDTPNLLLVPDDHTVEHLFMEMVRTYIHKNALREPTLHQIPTIMVSGVLKVMLVPTYTLLLITCKQITPSVVSYLFLCYQ